MQRPTVHRAGVTRCGIDRLDVTCDGDVILPALFRSTLGGTRQWKIGGSGNGRDGLHGRVWHCTWKSSMPTQAEAAAAAERHEHENDGHLAYVLAPDKQRNAA